MPDEADVTVVIPTHNRRTLLERTVRSVLGQRDVGVRVVVVDDGGSDGTADWVRSLGREDVAVVRHDRSRGVSAARNSGLALVATPWVAFVDDDDIWAPDKLRSQLEELSRTPGARWSCVGALHVDAGLRVLRHAGTPPSGDISAELLDGPLIPGGGSGVLVDSDLAREVGGFDESLGILADWDFYLRLSLRSPVASVNRPLVGYYIHSDSMVHDPPGFLRELFAMAAKHRVVPGGRRFTCDLSAHAVNLSRMAHRLGDDRLGRRMVGQEIRRAGFLPVAREVLRRARKKVAMRRRPRPPFTFAEGLDWLEQFGPVEA